MLRLSPEEIQHFKIVLETALLTASEPLAVGLLARLFDDELSPQQLETLLVQLQQDWLTRGVELLNTSGGWRFRARTKYQVYVDKLHPEKPPRYSRAVLETLAIIAYRQPVTRGDIESIRGVTVSTQIIRQLEERNWVEVIGHREVPGRPGLYATTTTFLHDFNCRTLADLPPLTDLGELQALLERQKEQNDE